METLNTAALFLAVIVVAHCKPFIIQTTAMDQNQAEAFRYVDNLLATARTHPNMSHFDPLKLNFHRQDMIDGFFILTNGTATGLSTIHRHEQCDTCEVIFNENDRSLTIKTVVMSNSIHVSARLQAQNDQGHEAEGRVYGTMHMLRFSLEIQVVQNGTATLQDYKLDSALYLEPEYCSEDNPQSSLKGIIHESMFYGFSTKYGFDIGRAVTQDLKLLVMKLVSETKFPIGG